MNGWLVCLGLLVLSMFPAQTQAAPKQDIQGASVDLMFGLFGSVESQGSPTPADLEGPVGIALGYEHRLAPWLHVGPRLIWALSESSKSDHEYSNVHLGLQVLPTWAFHDRIHAFCLASVGGSFMNRNDGGPDRVGWGHHFSVGIGARVLLRGMHIRATLSYLRSSVGQIESEESIGAPFTDQDIILDYTSLGVGIVF